MRAIVPALSALAICACTTPHAKVEGWPPLKTSVHVIDKSDIFPRCKDGVRWYHYALGMLPVACAWIDLDRGTCDIYVTSTTPEDTLEHERQHCAGMDHDGILQALKDRWAR